MPLPDLFERAEVRELIVWALKEDLGPDTVDVTSEALIPAGDTMEVQLVARESCCLSGVAVAEEVFRQVDPSLAFVRLVEDGTSVEPGEAVLIIRGAARSILTAERTALNFIQRMSGVATVTAAYVQAANNPDVILLDTRKTTPALRPFEKYAVCCGGGTNHRYGLYDAVLIKDNHLAAWSRAQGGGVGDAVSEARRRYPDLKIEVEVDSIEQLKEALTARPDWVLLDNMPSAQLRECVALCKDICKTEASGGITLATLHEIAQTGVDAISVGALTHSAPSIDLALDYVE